MKEIWFTDDKYTKLDTAWQIYITLNFKMVQSKMHGNLNTNTLNLGLNIIMCISVYYYGDYQYIVRYKAYVSTKAVISSTGIFVAIWVKIISFSFMPKIIRILRSCSMKIFCKFPTVNISKLNYWLVICMAKNFIWTTLKVIFSIFWFVCTLRFQIYK